MREQGEKVPRKTADVFSRNTKESTKYYLKDEVPGVEKHVTAKILPRSFPKTLFLRSAPSPFVEARENRGELPTLRHVRTHGWL